MAHVILYYHFLSLHIVEAELYYMFSKIGNGSSSHEFEPCHGQKICYLEGWGGLPAIHGEIRTVHIRKKNGDDS